MIPAPPLGERCVEIGSSIAFRGDQVYIAGQAGNQNGNLRDPAE